MTWRTMAESQRPQIDALIPDVAGQRLNLGQVLVLEGSAGEVRAVAVIIHGGHSFAWVGAVGFLPGDASAVKHLWLAVAEWARAHDVRVLGHGAGTDACQEILTRLGGVVRRPVCALIEVTV